ncbi:MAG TPA: lysophospholipid acyltransferase family protein [Chloroflexota bacterium]|jgi:1-acyl-sn-glycerol-3-phosphate acyltransferase|nr:lysophospholipid acyltransferase family protein [Chloroflexota bacterium]
MSERSIDDEWSNRSRVVYAAVRIFVSLIVRSGMVRLRVQGQERVPPSGPVLLVANHQSNLDPLLIGWLVPRPLSIPAKYELFRVPVLRWIMRKLGSFPVNRAVADAGSLRRSLEMLRLGQILAVFPEGTRTRTGAIGTFEPTISRLAVRTKTRVLPVALAGSGRILPPGRKWPRFGAVVGLSYGEPFELSQFYDRKLCADDAEQATEFIRSRVQAELEAAERLAGRS